MAGILTRRDLLAEGLVKVYHSPGSTSNSRSHLAIEPGLIGADSSGEMTSTAACLIPDSRILPDVH